MNLFAFDIFPKTAGAYLVGGIVRDFYLGRNALDYDVVVRSDPEKYARDVASKVGGHLIRLGRPGHELFKVISSDYIIDICAMVGPSIERDLEQRDFTINALAWDLMNEKIIDPLGGAQDLSSKQLRMVSPIVFEKDPVRLLRAFRFAAVLDFELERKTMETIARKARLINYCAGERIREELLKLLEVPNCAPHVLNMENTGLLQMIFHAPGHVGPIGQPKRRFRHPLDVTAHLESPGNQKANPLTDTLCHLENILNNRNTANGENLAGDAVAIYHNSLLKLAALLYDMGPTVPEKGSADTSDTPNTCDPQIQTGLDMLRNLLKLSNRQGKYLETVLSHLHVPFTLFRESKNKTLDEQKTTRFFMRCKNLSPDVAILALAVHKGLRSLKPEKISLFESFVSDLVNRYFTHFEPRYRKPPLINGHDLITELGLRPSPKMGEILSLIEEERLSGLITTREEALNKVKDMLRE